jgi:uncharacterized protein (TIGR02597 family)
MKLLHLLTLCALGAATAAMGQTTVYTDPVGFVTVTVPAQADAVLAVPMRRPAAFQGTVAAISGNDVTLSSAPTLPAGSTYALVLASGQKDGLVAKITQIAGAVMTVTLAAGDDLSDVATGASGDKVKIIPYWTPATLLPASTPAGTRILGFENSGTGINVSANRIFGYAGGGIWRNGADGTDASGESLAFGSAIIVRNVSNSPFQLSIVGEVPLNKHRLSLSTKAANTAQDIRFGYGSPILEALDNVGLGSAGEGDRIFAFDNTAAGFNKLPIQSLIMEGGVWKDGPGGAAVGSTFQFTPGFGYVYRKAASAGPATMLWSSLPGYLPLAP